MIPVLKIILMRYFGLVSSHVYALAKLFSNAKNYLLILEVLKTGFLVVVD